MLHGSNLKSIKVFIMEETADINRNVVPSEGLEPVACGAIVENANDDSSPEEDAIIASEDQMVGEGLEDVGPWILKLLREMQPEAEITMGSIKAMSNLLDSITTRVLEEAKVVSIDNNSTDKGPPLTSLDIHKALKRVLPGEPGEPLRPYLPAVTKQAWHMDKQSLKGIKKQRTGGSGGIAATASVVDDGGKAVQPKSNIENVADNNY